MTSSRAHQRAHKISGRARLPVVPISAPAPAASAAEVRFQEIQNEKTKKHQALWRALRSRLPPQSQRTRLRRPQPWGDSERYDFILDNGSRLLRVQIKATDCLRAHAYETRATYTVGKGRAVYGPKDIDFLVAHVIPLDLWYVLPVRACMPAPMLRFYPHRKAKIMRLEKYREAWHLMKSRR